MFKRIGVQAIIELELPTSFNKGGMYYNYYFNYLGITLLIIVLRS